MTATPIGWGDDFTTPRKYFDQLRLTVFSAEDQTVDEASSEWHLIVHSGGEGIDLNTFEAAVESFIAESGGVEREGIKYPPSYNLKIEKNHFSWGADAVVIGAVVAVSGWVASNVAWDLLKLFGRKLGNRIFDEPYVEPLTEDEAVRLVKGVVYRRHSVSPDLLRLTSADVNEQNHARLAFVDHNRIEYDVNVKKDAGVAIVVNISRKFPPVGE